MQTILGIIGSPRRLGNCEIMIKEISRQAPIAHELNLLRLPDFDLQPCKACYRCLFEDQKCVLEDDFHQVAEALIAADFLVVAAPTYFLAANACLKRFLDRGLALYAHIETLWHKPAVGIGIAGIEGKEGHTLLDIQSFLRLVMAEEKQTRMIYGALPGEIFLNDANKAVARDLAQALFAPVKAPNGPCCPVCGGDTFRFLGGRRIRCMLCSNAGMFAADGGQPAFQIAKDGHELFESKQGALNHRQWLLGMKSRFMSEKNALKAVAKTYLKSGQWIKPQKS